MLYLEMPKFQKTRRAKQARTAGQFSKQCNCLNHECFVGGEQVGLLQGKYQQHRSAYKELVKRHLLPSNYVPKWVCSGCLSYASKHFLANASTNTFVDEDSGDTEPGSLTTGDGASVDAETGGQPFKHQDVLDKIKETVNVEHLDAGGVMQALVTVANFLGKMIQQSLYNDGMDCIQNYSKQTDAHQWLSKQNSILLAFLEGCTGISPTTNNEKKMNSLIHIVEQVLYARNLVVVCPFAFQRNVVQYSYSRSKVCTTLTGVWEPAGGYTTVSNFLSAPSEPVVCPGDDVHVTIDNNQKVAKTSGRIKEDSKMPVSICTTVGFLQPPNVSNLQQNPANKPNNWQHRDIEVLSHLMEAVNAQESAYMDTFRKYRQTYIQVT